MVVIGRCTWWRIAVSGDRCVFVNGEPWLRVVCGGCAAFATTRMETRVEIRMDVPTDIPPGRSYGNSYGGSSGDSSGDS